MSDKSWASFGENIFVNAPIGIFTTDPKGIITNANRVSLEIHGEMIGKIFPDDFVLGQRLNYEIREVYEEKVGRLEVEYKIDQPSRTIRLIATLLRDEYYNPIGILFMCENITELREAQETVYDLKERLDYAGQLREIGLLARGVVHDIKHIFGIILNYIFALKKGKHSEEEKKHFLEMMERTSHDAVGITQQILTLSMGESLAQERVNINRIISELVRIIARSLPDNITLQADIPKRPLFVSVDSAQIQRVLLNLCLNARDAMPSGGRISIRLGKEKSQKKPPTTPAEYISLSVSDTGQGIKQELREKIFKPFFTTKTGGEGIGLGLSVVKEIADKAGGKIDLNSIPGIGTTFTLLLPSSPQKKKSRRPK